MDITMEFARRDDCLDQMVPSDLRELLQEIAQLREALDALIHDMKTVASARVPCLNDDGFVDGSWVAMAKFARQSAARNQKALATPGDRPQEGEA